MTESAPESAQCSTARKICGYVVGCFGGLLWAVTILLVSLPLWVVGAGMMKAGAWMVGGGYKVHDGMQSLNVFLAMKIP